jgi:chaperonin cofactor prefoldin
MHNIVGGYTVSQLRVMLYQQQRAKRQRIATLKNEINSRAKELAKVIQELEELERAENLLED